MLRQYPPKPYKLLKFSILVIYCYISLLLLININSVNNVTVMVYVNSVKQKKSEIYQFCDNCKVPSFTFHLKEAEMKITCKSITEIIKTFKSLCVLGIANISSVCLIGSGTISIHTE